MHRHLCENTDTHSLAVVVLYLVTFYLIKCILVGHDDYKTPVFTTTTKKTVVQKNLVHAHICITNFSPYTVALHIKLKVLN